MTAARLATGVRVSALVRRVNAEGGHATIIKKGDPTAGAVILNLCERGANPRLYERVLDERGGYQWRRIGLNLAEDPLKMAEFLERRYRIDPDLWVVELDIVAPERFIDKSFISG